MKHKERVKLEQEIKDLKKQLKDLSNLDEILEKQAVKDQSQPNERNAREEKNCSSIQLSKLHWKLNYLMS